MPLGFFYPKRVREIQAMLDWIKENFVCYLYGDDVKVVLKDRTTKSWLKFWIFISLKENSNIEIVNRVYNFCLMDEKRRTDWTDKVCQSIG